jgi:hypothetical protein
MTTPPGQGEKSMLKQCSTFLIEQCQELVDNAGFSGLSLQSVGLIDLTREDLASLKV